jgi:hypothetical protein
MEIMAPWLAENFFVRDKGKATFSLHGSFDCISNSFGWKQSNCVIAIENARRAHPRVEPKPDLHKQLKLRKLITKHLFYITDNHAGYNTPTT